MAQSYKGNQNCIYILLFKLRFSKCATIPTAAVSGRTDHPFISKASTLLAGFLRNQLVKVKLIKVKLNSFYSCLNFL